MIIVDYAIIVLVTSTPIILAALGEAMVERSGRVNLGVEGMMAFAASTSVALSSITGSPILGLIAGALSGLLLSSVYTLTVVWLKLDQIVVGLILSMAGLGLADLVASLGHRIGYGVEHGSPLHNMILILTLTLPGALWVTLYKTTLGIEIRAIGYDEVVARERGLRVDLLRAVTVSMGGVLAGIAGAYMALVLYGGKYFSGITGGWGWLAIGAVILGYWNPITVAGAAYTIGLLITLRPFLTPLGIVGVLATIAPYLAVIIALTLTSIIPRRKPYIKPPKIL